MTTRVLVATAEGLVVIDNGHETVEQVGRDVRTIATAGTGALAVVDEREIWRRKYENDWQHVANVDRSVECLLDLNGRVLAGTAEAHVLRIDNGTPAILQSFETAPTREEWFTPWGGPPAVRSLAAGASGIVFANVHVGGILRSDDAGGTWTPTIDIGSDVHEVKVASVGEREVVLAATAVGLATSDDRGASWFFDDQNLHATYARAVAVAGEWVLLTVSLGPRGGRAAIYRRPTDAPGSFEKTDRGLPDWFSDNINTGCLASSGKHAAFGTEDGDVYLSDDAGATWSRIASGLPSVRALHLAT